ncbi:MAG: YfhO family protein [Clostridia bacterium]|nr:YfhO family protein [Clostridia bacterium]
MLSAKEDFRTRLINGWRENKFLIVAFFLPLMIQWMIFIAMEVYPFGSNSVLVLDLNGQYVYFFEELRNKILGGGSMLYTWSRTLGGEFMGIYAYYLASPFSYLIALFPSNHITEGLLVIELLKTGSMGLTMGYYLKKTKKSSRLSVLIFSTCYAVSAYDVVYGHNTMWMDCVILLPLVTLGIEQLIKKRRFLLFVVTLSLSLLTSFYIGYMVCLYVAIYFFYYYLAHATKEENNFWLEKNHFWHSLLRIGFYSAIAICISMCIVYPAYTSLQFGKSTFSTTNWAISQRFDLMDFFLRFFPGTYDTVRPEGLPLLYCGVIALIFVPMYFICRKYSWQERLMGGAVLVFFFLCMNVSSIDIVWHGFQRPNWLNYRYSFMFVFLMLVFAYKAFTEINNMDFRFSVFLGGVLVVFLMLVQKQDYEYINDFSCIWLSVLCVVVLTGASYFAKSGKLRGMGAVIVLILTCLELFGAGLLNIVALDKDVVISSRTSYNSFMEKMYPTVNWVKEYDDSAFYRMEKTIHRKTNDPMTLGFYGISNSTSTLNKAVINLLNSYGYASRSHWTKYIGGTPVSDGLLDVRYVITNKLLDDGVRELLYTDEEHNYYVYFNPYALSLAYAVDAEAGELEITDYSSPFVAMNAILRSMTGEEDLTAFNKLNVLDTEMNNISTSFTTKHRKYAKRDDSSSASIVYTVDVKGGVPVYMCIPTDYPREASLKVNGVSKGAVMGNESDTVIYLGCYDYDQEITVTIELKDDPIYIMTGNDYFFYMDVEECNRAFEKISKGNLEITSFSDTHIEGSVNVPEDRGLLFTSIPYDEGWHVYVDGEQKELVMTHDALLAVGIEPGEHEVVFDYCPKCYTVGTAVSIAGLIALAALYVISIFAEKRADRKWREANAAALVSVPAELPREPENGGVPESGDEDDEDL